MVTDLYSKYEYVFLKYVFTWNILPTYFIAYVTHPQCGLLVYAAQGICYNLN